MEARSRLFHAIVLMGSSLAAACNHAPLPGPAADAAPLRDLSLPDDAPSDLAAGICPACADAFSPCCCTPDCQTCYPCYV